MTRTRHGGLGGMRRAGLGLAAVLTAGLAVVSGTALASTGSATSMAGMQMAGHGKHVGTTKGWYDGHTVTFKYTRNFSCKTPPASKASSKCEAGADYTQTPAHSFDPLYVVVPLGFTPRRSTLQCPVAGRCIDHPSTIDLSAVLGKGTGNLKLPPHSHIVATANGRQAEWWNVVVVGVTSRSSWNKIVHARSDGELMRLQRTPKKSGITGNIVTNLFLFFQVKR
jgi:hypothetical protein